MVPDVIVVRGEFAYLTEPLATEAADYIYGTGHRVVSGRYAGEAAEATRAQVYGKGVFAERFDWPAVALVHDRLAQVLDANLTTVAQAEARADAVLRRAAMGAVDGEILVPVNCGQELYDVVEVTDAGAGISAAKRRVLGIALRCSAGARPAYEQRVRLGGL
jgi:hypothetical protein